MSRHAINDPGTGARYDSPPGRLINKDGSFNVTRIGAGGNLRNLYQSLVSLGWPSFFALVVVSYFGLNLIFSILYFWIGTDQLTFPANSNFHSSWLHAFFFSVQTFTTVGYGGIAPIGLEANFVAVFEAFTGLTFFALATSLIYGRFSRPYMKLRYSEKAIIAPYQGNTALMLRFANARKNVLINVEAKVFLSFVFKKDGKWERTYYNLNLQLKHIEFFPLNWTLVHPIDQDSPLWGWKEMDFVAKGTEIAVQINGYDDTFSQVVHSRNSYTSDEIVVGAEFLRPYEVDEKGRTVLHLNKLSDFKKAELPLPVELNNN